MIGPAGGRPQREVVCSQEVPGVHFRLESARGVSENNRCGAEVVEFVDGRDDRVEVMPFVEVKASALQNEWSIVAKAANEGSFMAIDGCIGKPNDFAE